MNVCLKVRYSALCTMSLLFASCLAFICVAFSTIVHAELAPIPSLNALVSDTTGTLSAAQVAQLDAKLKAFESEKGSQIAVLIVPTTQPEDIAQYSMRVVEKWKLGRKKAQDGVLVLVAKNDRKMRIEVDSGLQGAIPDVYAKRIVSDDMAPKFKQGDFYGGLDVATQKIIGLVNGETLPAPAKPKIGASGIESILPLLLFGGLISGMMLRGMFGTFFGSALNGGLVGGVVWMFGLALGGAAILALMAFFITMMLGGRGFNGYGGIPMGGGGWSSGGGSSSGSIWGGGGGSEGWSGGGASGDW